MSILQTIDSKEYVCWSFRKSKNETAKPQKRKAGEATRTPILVTYSINYSIFHRKVRENFADWAGGCVQSIANVPLSAGQSRSEESGKRDGIEAGQGVVLFDKRPQDKR